MLSWANPMHKVDNRISIHTSLFKLPPLTAEQCKKSNGSCFNIEPLMFNEVFIMAYNYQMQMLSPISPLF